jgi:hypothetical protein
MKKAILAVLLCALFSVSLPAQQISLPVNVTFHWTDGGVCAGCVVNLTYVDAAGDTNTFFQAAADSSGNFKQSVLLQVGTVYTVTVTSPQYNAQIFTGPVMAMQAIKTFSAGLYFTRPNSTAPAKLNPGSSWATITF